MPQLDLIRSGLAYHALLASCCLCFISLFLFSPSRLWCQLLLLLLPLRDGVEAASRGMKELRPELNRP